jgi:2-isopropylmalate synthase
MPAWRYRPAPGVELADRRWPGRAITRAPRWCSVDLRDGNQALVEPMDLDRKLRLFELLVEMGFAEIEVGFPGASRSDFDFVRRLVAGGRVPDGVTIQVITSADEAVVDRTIESIQGARRVTVHLFTIVSELERRVVYRVSRAGLRDVAVRGARRIRQAVAGLEGAGVTFEYSPGGFADTDPDFTREVCEAVLEVWRPSAELPAILNLPNTVEIGAPNVFADRVEWCHRNLTGRDRFVLSVHTHNDRGGAVAAAELALLAGAERVEGTLFGNGERTGNADLVTLALNMAARGIDPGIDLSRLAERRAVVEACNRLPVDARHPYLSWC